MEVEAEDEVEDEVVVEVVDKVEDEVVVEGVDEVVEVVVGVKDEVGEGVQRPATHSKLGSHTPQETVSHPLYSMSQFFPSATHVVVGLHSKCKINAY